MKKDILRVFSSNLIKALVTFITAFIIPMVLSVDDYGYYKVFAFYASYIGVIHLGFCDGVYLDNGGKRIEEIDKRDISKEGSTLFWYNCIVSIGFITVSIIRSDFTIFCLGLCIIPVVMYTFYTYVYQATGNFDRYTKIMNISTTSNLVFNLILVLLRVRIYQLYILAYVGMQLVSFVAGTISFKKNDWIHLTSFKKDIFIKYIKLGILLMVGNFAYTLFIGIDKWFIQFTMPIRAFSMYSFAGQMLTVVNMFITPISMTLYSNFSRKEDHEFEKKLKKILVCILMVIPIAIYALTFIIEVFMQKYTDAIQITSLLLITQIFLSLNMAVFVNLYKAYQKQNQYFFRLIAALGIAAAADLIVAIIQPNTIAYAFATLISCLAWLGMNIQYFNYLKPGMKETIYVVLLLCIHIVSNILPNQFIRAGIYIAIYLVLTRYLMHNEWIYGIVQIRIIKQKLIKSRG